MANKRKRLTVVGIRAIKAAGRYSDGDGLYLLVKPDGRRTWLFRYRDRVTGKLRDKGLGPLQDVSLDEARGKAAAHRASLQGGTDPIDASKAERLAERLEHARLKTFGDCCNAYIAAHKASWRNAKHADQWRNTLDAYCADLLPLPVAEIDNGIVLKALEAIWSDKTETATRVRQRIEAVIDYATARGFRTGENPARWRGHLQKLLPAPAKLKDVQHHAALPYEKMAKFMAKLSAMDTLASKALTLQILTATRPGEAVAARWSEFDLKAGVWTIPKERMKANREHRAPLAPGLVKLLKAMPRDTSGFVFPGKADRHLTIAAPLALLKGIYPDLTCHGFRSTFRDWCGDQTAYPREVAEAALAHALKDKTEAAYRRTDSMEKRARLMAEWERYCYTVKPKASNVTPIGRKKAS